MTDMVGFGKDIIEQNREAILVFVATAIGFFVLLFVLGEILFPH